MPIPIIVTHPQTVLKKSIFKCHPSKNILPNQSQKRIDTVMLTPITNKHSQIVFVNGLSIFLFSIFRNERRIFYSKNNSKFLQNKLFAYFVQMKKAKSVSPPHKKLLLSNDEPVKLNMSFEDAIKLALNTPIKKSKVNKK